MATLNYLCRHDISDEDCYKCGKHGITLCCPANCPDFEDMRAGMDEETKKLRTAIMAKAGLKDRLPWEAKT